MADSTDSQDGSITSRMSGPASNQPATSPDPQIQLQAINLETAAAQLRKLNLEIDDLQSKRKWDEPLVRLIPVITALISIAGFIWGVHIYNQQQEKDRVTRDAERKSREQAQLRADYDNLLEISSNQKVTVARVLALRQNVDALIDSLYPPKAKVMASEEEKKNVEENTRIKNEVRKYMYILFSRDFDFTQPKHAQFDIAALQYWVDYKKDLEGRDPIINRYLQSFLAYRIQNPEAFKNITTSSDSELPELESIVGDPLKSMFEGFACHRDLLSGENEKNKVMSNLTKMIGNERLSAQLSEFPCPKIEALPKLPSN